MVLLTEPACAFWSASCTSGVNTSGVLGHDVAHQGEVAANNGACAEARDVAGFRIVPVAERRIVLAVRRVGA